MKNLPTRNLPTIYAELASNATLASNGNISPQQYDDFFDGWKKSVEWHCLVANCRRSKADELNKSALPLPYSVISDEYKKPHIESRFEGRCCALADGIGELVWMFVSVFKVLPILEMATPVEAIDVAALDSLEQPWISIYLPTSGAYFVSVNQQDMVVQAKIETMQKVGWLNELHIANYLGEHEADINLSVYENWFAYQSPEPSPLKLPSYLVHREYFTTHRGEIVAGYALQPDGKWQNIALNGLTCNDKTDPIAQLFKDPGFQNAVRANVRVFRPWFIQKEAGPEDLRCTTEDECHKTARQGHLAALGDHNKPVFGLTLTHNLVNQPFEESNVTRKTASTFTNLLITVPTQCEQKIKEKLIKKHKLRPSDLSETWLRSEMERVVRILWDNIDILKLPMSRQMMHEAEQDLATQLEQSRRYADMYREVQKPLNALLELSRNLTDTAGWLSMARGDHLQSLLANRHRLSMLFEEGFTDPRYGSVKIPKHGVDGYDDYNQMAANVLMAIAMLENDDHFDPDAGRSQMAHRLNSKLAGLFWDSQQIDSMADLGSDATTSQKNAHMRRFARLSILAPRQEWSDLGCSAGFKAAKAIILKLRDDWKLVPPEQYTAKPDPGLVKNTTLALASLKRRVHSNFKPSSIALNVNASRIDQKDYKTATLDDLASFMDPKFEVISDPQLSSTDYENMALFHQASFPFRSVGDLLTTIQAFFKDTQVSSGTLQFSRSDATRTLSIAVSDMMEADGSTKSHILTGNAADLAKLLREFKNPDNQRASLILGDFLTPVVALIQSRLRRDDASPPDYGLSISEEGGSVVLKFERSPEISFVWTIEKDKLEFISKGGEK